MATTFTLTVTSLKKQDELYDDVIKSATININANDTVNQDNREVEIYLNEPDTPDTFISFSAVTEQNVLTWVQNDPEVEHSKEVLKRNLIEAGQTIVSGSNLPWV